jgi:protein ImuB
VFAGLCLITDAAHAESSRESQSPLESAAGALLQLAGDFSPRYEMVRPHLVVVDISGLGRLLGTPREIGEAFCRTARDRGLTVAIGIASTQTTALLLALHQATPPHAAAASGVSATSVEPAKLADARAGGSGRARGHDDADSAEPLTQSARRASELAQSDTATRPRADRLIVVRLGREASALAPLPLSLLSALPSDRLTNDDVAFLRRRPDPSASSSPSTPSSFTSSSSMPPSLAGMGGEAGTLDATGVNHAANMGSAPGASSRSRAASPRGKTRGKTGRGGARNYRLAPSPSQSAERTDEAILDVLSRWGLKTLGEFAALPADSLFERLGREGLELQEVARGRDARPLVPTIAGEPFEASLALEWPIEELEPLSFVLTRLFEPLCARLERCDRGAAVLHVSLQLVSRECHARRLELPAPMRDPKVLRTLVLLDLESHPPSAGIDRVTLTIDPTPGRIVQHSLLMRPLPSPEQLSTLTARLTAVMGENRVGAPVLLDTHRPEAFAMHRFHVNDVNEAHRRRTPHDPRDPHNTHYPRDPHDADALGNVTPTLDELRRIYLLAGKLPAPLTRTDIGVDAPGFVLRRFRRPIPARVRLEHDRPVYIAPQGLPGGAVIQAAGPWRTSGEWWKNLPRLHPSNAPGASPDASPNASRDASPNVSPDLSRRPRPRRTLKSWNRDEWDVALTDGTIYRVHLNRDDTRWYVDGTLD